MDLRHHAIHCEPPWPLPVAADFAYDDAPDPGDHFADQSAPLPPSLSDWMQYAPPISATGPRVLLPLPLPPLPQVTGVGGEWFSSDFHAAIRTALERRPPAAPEPEIVMVVASTGKIVGATLGNDVNLRDFEGRSALLLAKAKDNNASCAIGPFVRLFDDHFGIDDDRLHDLGYG